MSGGEFAEQMLRESHEGRGPRVRGLTELRDEALRIAVKNGFKDATIAEDFMLIVSEVAEALEDHRAKRLPHELMYERRVSMPLTAWEEVQSYLSSVFGFIPSPELRYVAVLTKERSHVEADGREVLHKPVGIPSEMADIVIRVLHFCGKHGVDIERAVLEKMVYNETRGFKHGGKAL